MSDLRAMIEAARADAPSAAARAKVWAGVSGAVGEAATVAGGSAAAGSATAAKMLVLGTLLGGTFTVGLGAMMLFARGEVQRGPAISVAAPASGESAAPPDLAVPVFPARDVHRDAIPVSTAKDVELVVDAVPALGPQAMAVPPEAARREAAVHLGLAANAANRDGAGHDDALAREASLLADARNTLARGDAFLALQKIRGLRSLPARQLVPEELALEAQALRSLGLDDDARAVDLTLRLRFPDSVLGR